MEGRLLASERRALFLQTQLNRVINAPAWKVVKKCRGIVDRVCGPFPRVRKLLITLATQGPGGVARLVKTRSSIDETYNAFVRKHLLSDEEKKDIQDALERLSPDCKPLISILTPVYNTPAELLSEAVQSVRKQLYSHWELCLVDDASTAPHVRPMLEDFARKDKRIRVHFRELNGNISKASQDALEMARGEFVALLDHDDVIAPDALAQVVHCLAEHCDADMIYSDRDMLEMDGKRSLPYFKPDWSPDMFLSSMYVCHLSVFRTSLVKKIGGFRSGFEGSQDYDLVLRLTEQTTENKIRHLPKVLYSWRRVPGSTAHRYSAKAYADDAARRAIQEALQRRSIDATVESGIIPSLFRVKRTIKDQPQVSIIIPFRDQAGVLERCLASIRNKTSYKNFELVLVDNASKEPATRRLLDRERARPQTQVIHVDEPFNFSRLNNRAAAAAHGEHLLLLNNDTEVIEPDWLTAMLEHSQRPEVGAVGAKLLYADGRIQHAGVILGVGEVAGHAYRFCEEDNRTYFGSAQMIRNYSAVTGACLMTRKKLFFEMNGLNETELAVAYNDVDYCLRLREKGYLIVYTPYAKLLHHESLSRGYSNNPHEPGYMCRRWARAFEDPYYNPNLSRMDEDFSILQDDLFA